MGRVISFGPSSLSERKRKMKSSQRKQELQRKEEEARERRRLLETYGVLIPPVFLANKSDDPPLSSRVWERVVRESSSVQLQQRSSDLLPWAYRRRNNTDTDFDAGPLLGETLLTEYMTPGLFLSLPVAASGTNDGGKIVAALTHQTPSNNSLASPSLPSFISLTKCFHRNSFLFLPFPWKVETFLPQHSLLSPSSGFNSGNGTSDSTTKIIPSSMRFVADLSSPSNRNQTQLSWTTHFLGQDSPFSSSGSVEPSSTTPPLWNKLKGSWIEAAMVRPNWLNSGISLRMASSMTLNCLFENVFLEACRRGNDAYHEYHALGSTTTNNFDDFLRKRKRKGTGSNQDETLRVRVAAEYMESILAYNTNLSVPSLLGRGMGNSPVVTLSDTLLSLNLNGGETEKQRQPPPPLWLTLKQSRGSSNSFVSSWSLNLSQVVAFDRDIWNILEDRAPRVRNHVGWVCQIERFTNNGTLNPDGVTPSSSSESVLSFGASAQFNRNIAAKAILESKIGSLSSSSSPTTALASQPQNSPSAALKFAFVFKRWLEPQACLSVIQKIDLRTGRWSFLGLGLEIEQHKLVGAARPQSSNETRPPEAKGKRRVEYRDTADIDSASSVAPPTRVQMPEGKQ